MPHTLAERLSDDPYQGYAYAYPHKTAYRHFDKSIPLRNLWQGEDRDSLFLYVHLPFCEMRCGFCNLFTTTNPAEGLVQRYLAALETQTACTVEALGQHGFVRGAIGGGTPTFLTPDELGRLFEMLDRHCSLLPGMPLSCELSPATADPEKLAVLKACGVTRASIGVQSFIESETRTLGRPQKPATVHQALGRLRDAAFPVLNIDLIYGAVGQTVVSWEESLRAALEYSPEEIFLYPLYVRPLTGLDRIGRDPSDLRLDLYRAGRDFLLQRGYRQISMRLFRRIGCAAEDGGSAAYCCQEDGMVGLGAGARSYTRHVHYCTEYAVGRGGIMEIIGDYVDRSAAEHSSAVYGCTLDTAEQKRRYVIKSLLRADGLCASAYADYFGTECLMDFPELGELESSPLATWCDGVLILTDAGFERADTIGPWLYSTVVADEMQHYQFA
ncbi:STM4012 family radical SAM protein [Luteolibacter yonseiensis]|uniref:STM4012 family radical SAM protein n=1 Tax=Luteolibacter yonseiensis TaxID=1144680 RepID=A0A934R242_9BACT|nr:STM4012 family radical SAM protein [Luteolibacter yonseiensis]MBK1815042.1 STM4012 family radical SAM protein [Luteolibacter yonseiensis]